MHESSNGSWYAGNQTRQGNDTGTDELDDTSRWMWEAAIKMNRGVPWFVLALGFPANLACLVTVLHVPKVTSATLYVALLSVVDNICLVQKMAYYQITLHTVALGNGGCKALHGFGFYAVAYANWILILIAVERFAAVWFPLQCQAYFTRGRAAVSLVVLALVLGVVYVHFLWTLGEEDGKCHLLTEFAWFYEAWMWLSSAVYSFIPILLQIVLSGLIIAGVWRSRRHRRRLTSMRTRRLTTHTLEAEWSITIMLVSAILAFILLTAPDAIFNLINPYLDLNFGRMLFFKQVAHFMADLTHVINFYLYFLTAKKFRLHFMEIFWVRCHRRHRHRRRHDGEDSRCAQPLTCETALQHTGSVYN